MFKSIKKISLKVLFVNVGYILTGNKQVKKKNQNDLNSMTKKCPIRVTSVSLCQERKLVYIETKVHEYSLFVGLAD